MSPKLTFNDNVNFAGRRFPSGYSITVSGSIRDLYLELAKLCGLVAGTLGSLAERIEEALNEAKAASYIVDVTSSYTYIPNFEVGRMIIVDCRTLDKVLIPSLEGLEEYQEKIIKVESDDGNVICGLVISSESYDVLDERNYTIKGVFSTCADCLNSLEG